MKGPSAATLYGTDAANGVVVITTKRGRAGAARWTSYAEGGTAQDRNKYPTAYTLVGSSAAGHDGPDSTSAALSASASGSCTLDSLAALEPVRGRRPHADRRRQPQPGGRAALRRHRGGPLLPLGRARERDGRHEAPRVRARPHDRAEATRSASGRSARTRSRKNSVRMNLNAAVNPTARLSLSSGFINLEQRFSLESNATAGLGSQAFGGPGCSICTPAPSRQASGPRRSARRSAAIARGRRATPGRRRTSSASTASSSVGNANWRPTSWLQNRAHGRHRLRRPRRRPPAVQRRRTADHRDVPRRLRPTPAARSANFDGRPRQHRQLQPDGVAEPQDHGRRAVRQLRSRARAARRHASCRRVRRRRTAP